MELAEYAENDIVILQVSEDRREYKSNFFSLIFTKMTNIYKA